jgi:hypothetical protein
MRLEIDGIRVKVIFSSNLKKYVGCVYKKKNYPGPRPWIALIQGKDAHSKHFKTELDAKVHLMKRSIKRGTVKNVIFRIGKRHWCTVGSHLMRVSKASLPILDKYVFHAYPRRTGHIDAMRAPSSKHKRMSVARLLIHIKPGESVDHINGNTLDNRLRNLRSASRRMQDINRPVFNNSATGQRGVTKQFTRGVFTGYRARWEKLEGGTTCKHFTFANCGSEKEALRQAIAFRRRKEAELEHYREGLKGRPYAKEARKRAKH